MGEKKKNECEICGKAFSLWGRLFKSLRCWDCGSLYYNEKERGKRKRREEIYEEKERLVKEFVKEEEQREEKK